MPTEVIGRPSVLTVVLLDGEDRNVLPLPGSLRGGAAGKVVTALLTRGLIHEQATDSFARADAALNTLWRNAEDGRGVQLRITPAGLAAIGVDAQAGSDDHSAGDAAGAAAESAAAARESVGSATRRRPRTARTTAPAGKQREGTKQALLIGLLRRPEGATIAEIVSATGWQPHTVRGAFAGALKKRLGLDVTSGKINGQRVYRLPPA